MKIGKLLLSAGLLASLVTPLSAYNVHAAPQENVTKSQSQDVQSSYTREYVTLSVSGDNGPRRFKIDSTFVAVEMGSENVDVRVYRDKGYTRVKAVNTGKALISDVDNKILYEITIEE